MPRRTGRRGGRSRPSPFSIALAQAPFSDQTKIVFRYDPYARDYSQQDFNPLQTQGRVTQEDITRVFTTLKQLPNFNMGGGLLQFLIPLTFFCIFCGFFIFIYFFISRIASSAAGSGNVMMMPMAMIGVFCIMVTLILGITFGINYYSRQKMQKRTEEIRNCLQEFNQKEFVAKEVSWKVGTLGAWI